MASFNFVGIDQLLDHLQVSAKRINERGPEAVLAAAEIAQEAMKDAAPVRTGALRSHIKIKGPNWSPAEGHFCEVFPDGKNRRGQRYATIGFVLEYGRSDMPARPWMRPAMDRVRSECQQAMVDVIMRD